MRAPDGDERAAGRPAPQRWPSDALAPGQRCGISEAEWFALLERSEPLFQWGGAFLHDEGAPSQAGAPASGGAALLRAYLRDDSGRGAHLCLRFDAATSAEARRGVAEVEALSRAAADRITAGQAATRQSAADLAAEQVAGAAFTDAAEQLWRRLLSR